MILSYRSLGRVLAGPGYSTTDAICDLFSEYNGEVAPRSSLNQNKRIASGSSPGAYIENGYRSDLRTTTSIYHFHISEW